MYECSSKKSDLGEGGVYRLYMMQISEWKSCCSCSFLPFKFLSCEVIFMSWFGITGILQKWNVIKDIPEFRVGRRWRRRIVRLLRCSLSLCRISHSWSIWDCERILLREWERRWEIRVWRLGFIREICGNWFSNNWN